MIPDNVVALAQQVQSGISIDDIMPLSGGFSSQAYKVEADQPFVLLIERPNGVSKPEYGHGFVVLHLLDRHGYQHAPKPLWLATDHSAIALSYFDGQPVDQFNFENASFDTKELVLDMIDRLFDVTAITMEEYQAVAAEFDVTPLPPKTTQDSARLYGTDWLAIVEAGCPDPSIVGWLQRRVPQSIAMAEMASQEPLLFSHDDPSNPNFLVRPDGQWILIDWDSARFVNEVVPFIVSYTTLLVNFMRPFDAAITEHVANRFGLLKEQLAQDVLAFRKFNQVFDVNWAAMMMAKAAKGEAEDSVDHYRAIARERIAHYEAQFGTE